MREEGRSIKLAQVPPFRLGEVLVDPPRRRVSRGDRSEILEPRVMQVLVVLAEANGAVISRDELIERCWGGRIVGENAINRAISHIRQMASDLGVDCFELETITKVGYRMVVVNEAAAAPAPDIRPPWPEQSNHDGRVPAMSPIAGLRHRRASRRRVIAGGGAALAAAATGVWYWTKGSGHQPHPEAVELNRRGQIAQRQGVPEQVRQAVSFFREATEIDPLYAEAWGGLALAYRHILEGYADAELDGLPGLIESAARRALTLDPDNADAQLALVIIKPYFRNWRQMEADLQRVGARHPDHWFVLAQLGIIRYEVGRWRDGLAYTERQLEVEPLIPIPHINRARALWAVGRLQEAETALDRAIARWPGNFPLWNLKFGFLLHNRRPSAAAAFVLNPDTQPENLGPNAVQWRVTLARAVERGEADDVSASLAEITRQAIALGGSAIGLAPLFVLLGRADLALLTIDRYFLGGPPGELGGIVAPPTTYERRYTAFLFMPNMAPLWRDQRFAALLDRIGLERYWRDSGTLPDYRRRS